MITKNQTEEEVMRLAQPCRCSSCSNGCRFGSGFLAADDKKKIAGFLKINEKELEETYLEETELFHRKMLRPKLLRENKPYGRCVFFDEQQGCTIHEVKPMECRLAMPCKPYGEQLIQWFTLNHVVDADDPESIRQWSIYLKHNDDVIPGGKLEELVPEQHRLKSMLSYGELQ